MSLPDGVRVFDAIATRFGGWLGVAGAAAEILNPNALALDLHQAVGLGVGGLLLGTGRANVVVDFIKNGVAGFRGGARE